MISILLVEDNKNISKNIIKYFEDETKITTEYDGEDAIKHLNMYTYDIVILDLMLTEVDGMIILNYI